VEVPSDDDGLNLAALEAILERGVRPRFIYIVPTHANPTGATLPSAHRQALVALALRFRFFVVADEVYQHLSWGRAVPARMRAWDVGNSSAAEAPFDGEDRPLAAAPPGAAAAAAPLQPAPGALVVSISSFTKILAPGLRLGWVEGPPAVLTRLAQRAYLVSGGGVAPFVSLVVLEALRSGAQDAYLARLTAAYSLRCGVLCDALRAAAADAGWSFRQPSGGYFVWLRLPEGVTAAALMPACKARSVAVLDGARCSGGTPEQLALMGGVADVHQHVRLCFANLDEQQLRDGVAKLAAALADARALLRAAAL
jgi:2-aminoadipate transaminase